MHNPQSTSILEHALQIATLARPLIETIQRKDRDLASQVRRAVRVTDLQGGPLQGQTHGLKDKTVGHIFHLRDSKVARFDIREDH